MATYSVTTIVTCADAAEFSSLQAHLTAHNAIDGNHPGWVLVQSDSAARTVKMVKEDTNVSASEWR